jgi:hypothetical protein
VGVRFFAHVQTGPGAHRASHTMGTESFPGLKQPGRGADHPPLLVPSSRMSRAIPLPPSGPSGLLRGTFTFYTIKDTTFGIIEHIIFGGFLYNFGVKHLLFEEEPSEI